MGWSRSLAIEDTVQGIQNFQKWRSFFESDPNCGLSLESFRSGFLGGGFTYFLCSSLFGEDSHFDSYFSKG